MSFIRFATENGICVDLAGCERAYFARLIREIGMGCFSLFDTASDPCFIRRVLPKNEADRMSRYEGYEFSRACELYLTNSLGESNLIFEDGPKNFWHMLLNTCLRIGGDPLKLATRIHGQCELHCWVAEENRLWLANIIKEGLEKNIFRKTVRGQHLQWEILRKFVTRIKDDPGEVVLSYSVCDFFGSNNKKWSEEIKQLHPSLELSPHNWDTYYFSHGIATLDLEQLFGG